MSTTFPLSTAEYQAPLREDLTGFIERAFYELNSQSVFLPGQYIELLAATLDKCRTGETKRLIINLPPRTLKSHAASVAFPAWLLGHDPTIQIICASYGRRTLAPDSDSVIYHDRVVHVAGYASRFLFTGEQLNQPVERLSGGERARVLIARLMLQPADVLILDEPTNDLDIPTLEILEESLLEFTGALILVTHDRYLLDHVTNAVLGLDGHGNAVLFADYLQWETWRVQQTRAVSAVGPEEAPHPVPAASSASRTRRKLSYMEQREYDTLEKRIDEAEARLRAAEQQIEDAEVVVDPEAPA